MPIPDLPRDAAEALVLLWHYTQTSSPQVPAWARIHSSWPTGDSKAALHLTARLHNAAQPAIAALEAWVRDGKE